MLLTGCATDPVVKKKPKTYKQRVSECVKKFMTEFGTDIEKTYNVCEKIEKSIK
jgi:hypothetical protein